MLRAIKSKHQIETKAFFKSYAKDFNKAFEPPSKITSEEIQQAARDQANHDMNFGDSKLKREDFLMYKMHQNVLKKLEKTNKDIYISSLVDIKSNRAESYLNPNQIGFDQSGGITKTYIEENDIL